MDIRINKESHPFNLTITAAYKFKPYLTYLSDSSVVMDLLLLVSALEIYFSRDFRLSRSSSKSLLSFKINTVSELFVGVEESKTQIYKITNLLLIFKKWKKKYLLQL